MNRRLADAASKLTIRRSATLKPARLYRLRNDVRSEPLWRDAVTVKHMAMNTHISLNTAIPIGVCKPAPGEQ